MLSSLLRPKRGRRRVEHSPFSSQFNDPSSPIAARNQRLGTRHATADFTETDVDDDITETEDDGNPEDEEGEEDEEDEDEEDSQDEEDEDGEEESPLLPIFSAAHLGSFYSRSFYDHLLISE